MTVQTQTFTSPSSPQWESQFSPPPSLLSTNRGPSSPYLSEKNNSLCDDKEDDIISAAHKGASDGQVWDGPSTPSAMSFGVDVASRSPPLSRSSSRTEERHRRRSSRLERVAKSEGEEDSRDLVVLEDLERETSAWDLNHREFCPLSLSSSS